MGATPEAPRTPPIPGPHGFAVRASQRSRLWGLAERSLTPGLPLTPQRETTHSSASLSLFCKTEAASLARSSGAEQRVKCGEPPTLPWPVVSQGRLTKPTNARPRTTRCSIFQSCRPEAPHGPPWAPRPGVGRAAFLPRGSRGESVSLSFPAPRGSHALWIPTHAASLQSQPGFFFVITSPCALLFCPLAHF